ncbi:MAG: hypothetical protein ICV63_03740 [Coleofasciculus sp. Co-bin14]|nr:hypothetical protein [Coleofasciculus sp. Co-bin14]
MKTRTPSKLRCTLSDLKQGKDALNIFVQYQNQVVEQWKDWSQWDDFYTFIEDGNQTFIQRNLSDSYLGD